MFCTFHNFFPSTWKKIEIINLNVAKSGVVLGAEEAGKSQVYPNELASVRHLNLYTSHRTFARFFISVSNVFQYILKQGKSLDKLSSLH